MGSAVVHSGVLGKACQHKQSTAALATMRIQEIKTFRISWSAARS